MYISILSLLDLNCRRTFKYLHKTNVTQFKGIYILSMLILGLYHWEVFNN